jgi:hypothetical protein
VAIQTQQIDGHTVQEGSANRQLDAGNQAMRLSRNEFWATLDDVPPPRH